MSEMREMLNQVLANQQISISWATYKEFEERLAEIKKVQEATYESSAQQLLEKQERVGLRPPYLIREIRVTGPAKLIALVKDKIIKSRHIRNPYIKNEGNKIFVADIEIDKRNSILFYHQLRHIRKEHKGISIKLGVETI